MENISRTAIISLGISLLSLALFVSVFYQFNMLILWIIASIAAVIFPFYSKYRRLKTGTSGKGLEIAAFVIGVVELYLIILFATGLPTLLVDILVLAVCVLYMMLFKKVTPDTNGL